MMNSSPGAGLTPGLSECRPKNIDETFRRDHSEFQPRGGIDSLLCANGDERTGRGARPSAHDGTAGLDANRRAGRAPPNAAAFVQASQSGPEADDDSGGDLAKSRTPRLFHG